ncbi:hypothetical protein ACLOJK_028280 [Asimina triloba]
MAAQDPTANNHHSLASSMSRGQQISVTRPLRSARQERQQVKPSNQIQNHGPHPGSRYFEPISSTPKSDDSNKVDWGRSSPTNSKRQHLRSPWHPSRSGKNPFEPPTIQIWAMATTGHHHARNDPSDPNRRSQSVQVWANPNPGNGHQQQLPPSSTSSRSAPTIVDRWARPIQIYQPMHPLRPFQPNPSCISDHIRLQQQWMTHLASTRRPCKFPIQKNPSPNHDRSGIHGLPQKSTPKQVG